MTLLQPYRICGTLALLLFPLHIASAGSATWDLNAANGDWNTAANWMPNTVPNSATDVATFSVSNLTDVSVSSAVSVSSVVFAPGASAFSISAPGTAGLSISGPGVINNSGVTQNFVGLPGGFGSSISFGKSASAGAGVTYTAAGGSIAFVGNSTAAQATLIAPGILTEGGGFGFYQNSTAGNAVMDLGGGNGSVGQAGGVAFLDSATAGAAVIVAHGSTTGSGGTLNGGAIIAFNDGTNAGSASLTADGGLVKGANGAEIDFYEFASAGNATVIANGGASGGHGGKIFFSLQADGGTGRFEVFGNATLQESLSPGHPLSLGSIEGDGTINPDANGLLVGGNNLSTVFSGQISPGGTDGGLTKIGSGTLTLTGANTYAGGTTVSAGSLVVSNSTGSGTGTGAVNVNAGTLGGHGVVTGAVTIGTGSGSGAFLAPAAGTKKQATLTTLSALTFNSGATYSYTFKAKGKNARADSVVANGVTINSGATFNFSGQAQGTLRSGLTFTVLKNTSASAISGTFSNLPDGAILTVNGNNFQANYEGGDGNDLTLTVQ